MSATVIWATTKVTLVTNELIFDNEIVITASLKSISASTKVILVTKKLMPANKKWS